MAAKHSSKPQLVAITADSDEAIRIRALYDIERAVNALYVIKRFAIDAVDKDNAHYLNAIRDLAQMHGKRLDDTLVRLHCGPACGIFDEDD